MFLRVEIDFREIAMKDAAIGDPMGHQVMAMAHLLMVKRCDDTEHHPMVRRDPMTLLAAMAHGTHMATTLMDRRIHPARMLPNPVRPTTSQIAKPRPLFESLVSTRSRVSGPSQPGTGLLYKPPLPLGEGRGEGALPCLWRLHNYFCQRTVA